MFWVYIIALAKINELLGQLSLSPTLGRPCRARNTTTPSGLASQKSSLKNALHFHQGVLMELKNVRWLRRLETPQMHPETWKSQKSTLTGAIGTRRHWGARTALAIPQGHRRKPVSRPSLKNALHFHQGVLMELTNVRWLRRLKDFHMNLPTRTNRKPTFRANFHFGL